MAEIISASRRTDIPAHYSEWLLRRLREGRCVYWHPFARRWREVSLAPQDVLGMVLWTRNIKPLMWALPKLRERTVLYVQFTLTGHPRELEPGVLPPEEAVGQMRQLAAILGPESVVWRFDPIVHTQHQGPEDTLARFRRFCTLLEGATQECVFSFMAPYRRQQQAFSRLGLEYREPDVPMRLELAHHMASIAAEHGITLAACCNPEVVGAGVQQAQCVSADRLRALGAPIPQGYPHSPSRPGCGCARSVDIGAYDLCPTGCAYCYANRDAGQAAANYARHDPRHQGLAEAYLARATEDGLGAASGPDR